MEADSFTTGSSAFNTSFLGLLIVKAEPKHCGRQRRAPESKAVAYGLLKVPDMFRAPELNRFTLGCQKQCTGRKKKKKGLKRLT